MLAGGEEGGVAPGVEGVGEGASGGFDELGTARVEQRGDRQLEVGQVAGGQEGIELLAGAPDVGTGDDQAGAVALGKVGAAQGRARGDPGAGAEPGRGGAMQEALPLGLDRQRGEGDDFEVALAGGVDDRPADCRAGCAGDRRRRAGHRDGSCRGGWRRHRRP